LHFSNCNGVPTSEFFGSALLFLQKGSAAGGIAFEISVAEF